ncbi:MAG: 50S ribosomal protein L11 [Hydrotalea sp.]|nr:50S ribosomal protein L11 [Hydrotalea sp.]
MAKKITGYVKLQAGAGQANPSNVGQALGPRGINIMGFCKDFNAQTQKMEAGAPIPVIITVYEDRSFSFIIKKPPVSFYLKKAAKIEKGTGLAGREIAGKIGLEEIKKIATEKMAEMNAASLESAIKEVKGSARSMGLEVVE